MVIIQSKSKRKPSGARYKSKIIKKRQHLAGRHAALTKIGAKRVQNIRARSHISKLRLLTIDKVNLYDPSSKSYAVVEIKNVNDSPQDKNFIRRKIMSKGSIIETARGIAKITNRPGQDGMINAVLVEK
ncbi:TPA: 30S ribosomal protein S8e [Candidatus Woesearchaeota archaeon]|nr:30S ribosomal protein S8e [Candidatus Woesearchaeota archaeon]HIH31575.1 30S ribosomal protein S8e [Candidatus Woesearchaeota archaeon]HIH54268.1 30S ribosomal protein S8e [Candidatus Woesearchaeota archaeon]HIJ02543.1 30S ribosomal protein S8e [Candidatus Woesearchaeota archaeon]HIJ13411.1 30S ribosomal protein S8e [Candidatus Woesearchaeota archaeon]